MQVFGTKTEISMEEEEHEDDVKAFNPIFDTKVVSSVNQITDWLRAKDKGDEIQQQWYHIAAVIDRLVFCVLVCFLTAMVYPFLSMISSS